MNADHPPLRSFGRTKARPIKPRQAALVDTLLPRIALPEPAQGRIEPHRLAPDAAEVWLEIGFGGGEHLAERADMLPDHGLIGCEPFLNGVVGALSHIRDRQLTNVRLHHGDALDVLRRVPDGALSFVYLLHPDPWPKARHAKRRMINDGPLALVAAKLRPGGEFRFSTDHPVYLRHALMVMRRHADSFEWLVDGPQSWRARPGGWSETRYEAKARQQGHEVWYFRYRRR